MPMRTDEFPPLQTKTTGRTRLRLIAGALIAAAFVPATYAASLNKCVDAYGKVTYSNLPCKGANDVRKIEIDPAPPVPKPVVVAPPALPPAALPSAVVPVAPKAETPIAAMPEKPPVVIVPKSTPAATEKKAEIKMETFGAPKKTSQNNCDSLSDKLGLVLDKMDAARRKGYTQKQMDDWNSEVKTLERKKQQAGCF